MSLISFTSKGMYCEAGDFFIDPHRSVHKALVTHGHSDHAKAGHGAYLCVEPSAPILKHRLGKKIPLESMVFGEERSINGVKVSFHPAGHIAGSAQIRVEYQGEVWAVSGDYKVEKDGFTEDFEAVKCHTFVSECTFGLPLYHWEPQAVVMDQINSWWAANRELGMCSLLLGYSLGKSQRLLANIDTSIGPIYAHNSIFKMNATLRAAGWQLPETELLHEALDTSCFPGSLVLAPSAILNSTMHSLMQPLSVGNASGWMALRNTRRWGNADTGFVLSDHADWQGLQDAIKATEASNIILMHGFTEPFAEYLREQGYNTTTEEELKRLFR